MFSRITSDFHRSLIIWITGNHCISICSVHISLPQHLQLGWGCISVRWLEDSTFYVGLCFVLLAHIVLHNFSPISFSFAIKYKVYMCLKGTVLTTLLTFSTYLEKWLLWGLEQGLLTGKSMKMVKESSLCWKNDFGVYQPKLEQNNKNNYMHWINKISTHIKENKRLNGPWQNM